MPIVFYLRSAGNQAGWAFGSALQADRPRAEDQSTGGSIFLPAESRRTSFVVVFLPSEVFVVVLRGSPSHTMIFSTSFDVVFDFARCRSGLHRAQLDMLQGFLRSTAKAAHKLSGRVASLQAGNPGFAGENQVLVLELRFGSLHPSISFSRNGGAPGPGRSHERAGICSCEFEGQDRQLLERAC